MTKVYANETDELHDKFGDAIAEAWAGTKSVVEQSETHEASHVARLVHGAPAGMVAAIKNLPQVQSAEVRGMFCHRSPWAFWDDPKTGGGLVCRELADLMVEVEVVRGGVTASRALLVQVKKANKKTKWKPGVKVSGLDLGQRHLFHALPAFCVELPMRPTKDRLVAAGVTTITTPNLSLSPYALANLLQPQHPGGLVYAALNPHHQHKGPPSPTQPWLAEDGRPQNGGSSAVFTVDFARALAEMVVAGQSGFGVRTQPPSASNDDWSRLIHDFKDFARWRAIQGIAKGDRFLDVVLKPGSAPNGDVLYNVQQFVSHHGQLMALCSHASSASKPYPALTDFTRAFTVGAQRRATHEHRQMHQGDDGPPFWPDFAREIPWQGFGLLQVRVRVADERVRRPA